MCLVAFVSALVKDRHSGKNNGCSISEETEHYQHKRNQTCENRDQICILHAWNPISTVRLIKLIEYFQNGSIFLELCFLVLYRHKSHCWNYHVALAWAGSLLPRLSSRSRDHCNNDISMAISILQPLQWMETETEMGTMGMV